MDKEEIYNVSELETSTRLGNRDISLTPFTEIAMEKMFGRRWADVVFGV